LVRALEAGQIAGAALDVFEGQPLPMSSPLLSAPNLLLTPHIAGATRQTVERHSIMMVEAIEALLDGHAIPHLVNPDYQVARAR
jgi:phosphoglycerate dehydrogenase-like enzyme